MILEGSGQSLVTLVSGFGVLFGSEFDREGGRGSRLQALGRFAMYPEVMLTGQL